jgi:hypothetical protein
MMEELWKAGATVEIIMLPAAMKDVISGMQEKDGTRVRVFENQEKITFEVNTITDALGNTVKVIYNRLMPAATVLFYNSEDWQEAVFRAPASEEAPKMGDYKKAILSQTLGLEHRNPWASGMIVGKQTPASVLTDAGYLQVSVSGGSWVTSFPGDSLVAGSPVDFQVRIRSDSMSDLDDGTYEYDFKLTGASGGLSLVNTSRDVAHITGTTPADQAGLTLNVTTQVIDSAGNAVDADVLSGIWGEPGVQATKKPKSTK